MRPRRNKKAQKILQFYYHRYSIKAPFNIIVDGTFCNAALEGKVKITEQIPKYLEAESNFLTTQCIILEIERLSNISRKLIGPYMIVKQYRVRECGHEGKPIPASACIKSLLQESNPKKYIIATQDRDLRHYIRKKVNGTPLLSFDMSAPVLERPRELLESSGHNSTLTAFESETLQKLKEQHLEKEVEVAKPQGKKRKRALNPNPLSCKKSKKKKPVVEEKKRTRKRKKH